MLSWTENGVQHALQQLLRDSAPRAPALITLQGAVANMCDAALEVTVLRRRDMEECSDSSHQQQETHAGVLQRCSTIVTALQQYWAIPNALLAGLPGWT